MNTLLSYIILHMYVCMSIWRWLEKVFILNYVAFIVFSSEIHMIICHT